MSGYLLTHIEDGESHDLPSPVDDHAVMNMLVKLLANNLIEDLHVTTITGEEIIVVKG